MNRRTAALTVLLALAAPAFGREPIPNKLVVLTFDDASKSHLADARRQLGRFPDAVHNGRRIHSALGYLTPAEFERPWRADRNGRPVVQ